MDEDLADLAAALRAADTGVVFTGAGVSAPSGIPDFRSEDGIWAEHDPEAFHVREFQTDPGGFWETLLDVYDTAFAGDPEPNAAHRAIARLEEMGHVDAVITQNGDGLHQRAGSEDVIELHGSFQEVVCKSCPHREPLTEARSRAAHEGLPPICPTCGSALKPGSVLFGEQVPDHALFRAHALAERSDVFIVAGSSLTVEPAASLPETAVDRDASLAIVNLESTPLGERADYTLHEDVTTVLPRLADAM